MGFKVLPKVKLDKLDKRLFGTNIYVGYAEDETHHSGMSAAQIGALMSEGGTGPEGNPIPARPHIAQGLEEGQDSIRRAIKAYAGTIFGIGAKKNAADKIAEAARNAVVDYIYSGELEANAPYTIEKKGSDQPLVETGELVHLLEARVVKGGI